MRAQMFLNVTFCCFHLVNFLYLQHSHSFKMQYALTSTLNILSCNYFFSVFTQTNIVLLFCDIQFPVLKILLLPIIGFLWASNPLTDQPEVRVLFKMLTRFCSVCLLLMVYYHVIFYIKYFNAAQNQQQRRNVNTDSFRFSG